MASIVDAGVMTKSQTGLIAAAFYLVYAPFQIVGGIAADKYSPSKLIVIGMLGAGVCNLLVYLVEGYVAMIIIWSLNAVLQFGIWPSIFKIVVSELAPEDRMRGIFFINFSSSFGLLLSYGIAIFISEWKLNFLVSAITLFLLTAVFLAVYKHLSSYMVENTETAGAKTNSAARISGKELFVLLLKAGIPLMLIVGMAQSMINLGVKALAPTMLMESYEAVSPSLANALNIILVIAGPLGLCVSRLSFVKKFSEPLVITCFFAVMLVPLFVITFIGKLPVALIVAALAFLMVTTSGTSIFFSYIYKKFEKYGSVATLSGLFNCMSSLGIVLANYVFARIADSFGWEITTICWLVFIAAAFVLMLISVPVWHRFEKKYL
jgi:OPA family glycerol-3-phosphate transporter-like MFS transporter